MANLINHI